jgi:hypothetical protein
VVCDGWGAALVARGRGEGEVDRLGVAEALGDGDRLGVRDTKVDRYGVGVALRWWAGLGAAPLGERGCGCCGAVVPASATVPTSTPVSAPPTALTPATVSDRRRAAPP